jgi:CRP-like cAMP-binding protein
MKSNMSSLQNINLESNLKQLIPDISIYAKYVKTNSTIYNQGEFCNQVFLLTFGYVKLSQISRYGKNLITTIISKNEWFSPCLNNFNGAIAYETATSKGDIHFYALPNNVFKNLLAQSNETGLALIEQLSNHRQTQNLRIEALTQVDVNKRIALILNDLVVHQGGPCAHGYLVDIHLNQQELSEMVCASRPVVSTLLNQLRERGILSYSRTHICIDKPDTLKQLASDC